MTTDESLAEAPASCPVVVDTPAWIEALRPDGSSTVRRLVDEAIGAHLAVVLDPVVAELLSEVVPLRQRWALGGL